MKKYIYKWFFSFIKLSMILSSCFVLSGCSLINDIIHPASAEEWAEYDNGTGGGSGSENVFRKAPTNNVIDQRMYDQNIIK